jgi:hypothetical protein
LGSRFTELTETLIVKFIIPNLNRRFVSPQAGDTECGTLGILYLKELLKNGGDQLNNLSLRFPLSEKVLSGKDSVNRFLFPAPQALRYSQSSFYNEVLLAMLEETDTVQISREGTNYTVNTLQKMLSDSVKVAEEKGDTQTVAADREVLNKLPEFRKKWMQAYEATQPKRQAMDRNEINLFLAYKAKRMEQHRQTDELQGTTAKTVSINSSASTTPKKVQSDVIETKPDIVVSPPAEQKPRAISQSSASTTEMLKSLVGILTAAPKVVADPTENAKAMMEAAPQSEQIPEESQKNVSIKPKELNAYEVLGVEPRATREEIETAKDTLTRKLNSDLLRGQIKEPEWKAKSRAIGVAYDCIKTDDNRKKYDEALSISPENTSRFTPGRS